jgi:hypothetical protein
MWISIKKWSSKCHNKNDNLNVITLKMSQSKFKLIVWPIKYNQFLINKNKKKNN